MPRANELGSYGPNELDTGSLCRIRRISSALRVLRERFSQRCDVSHACARLYRQLNDSIPWLNCEPL